MMFRIICLVVLLNSVFSAVQRISQQPKNKTAQIGSTVLLTCQVSNRKGKVTWTKNGFGLGYDRDLPHYPRYRLTGSDDIGSFNLFIEQVQLVDDDFYQCQVSPSAGDPMVLSVVVKLDVLVPPKTVEIKKQPIVPVLLNQPSNITCTARGGRPPPTITWSPSRLFDKTNIHYSYSKDEVNDKLYVATSRAMVVAAKRHSGTQIKCHATNRASTEPVIVTAVLDVRYAPQIVLQHNGSTMMEFQHIRFVCMGDSNPYGVTWRWYRNGIEETDGVKQNTFVTLLTRRDNGADISCMGTNSVGSNRTSLRLNVKYGPKFIGKPKHVNVEEGKNALLHCSADGNPTPGIHWTKKGSNDLIHIGTDLKFRRVHKSQFGIYVCTAVVHGFVEISQEIHLIRNGKPKIIPVPKQYGESGKNVRLVCTVNAVPKPSVISWSRGGRLLDPQLSVKYSVSISDTPYNRTSVLRITNVQKADYGHYNCSAANVYGSDTLTIYLERQDASSWWPIIGGIIGGVVFVVVLIVIAAWIYCNRHRGSDLASSTNSESSILKKPKMGKEGHLDYQYADTINDWRQYKGDKDFHFVDDLTSGDYRHLDELNATELSFHQGNKPHGSYLGDDNSIFLDRRSGYSEASRMQHPDLLPHLALRYSSECDVDVIPLPSALRATPISVASSENYSRLPAADPATARYGTNV